MIALNSVPGGLQLTTPYDAAFLHEFKLAVPHTARQWAKPHWIVDVAYGPKLIELIYAYFGQQLSLPQATAAPATPEIRAIELRYLGRCKERGDGSETSAYGYAGGAWSVVLPESVLRAWFYAAPEREQQGKPQTLFAVLGIAPDADTTAIKKAFRRLALQWHPDTCKEPDAAEQFRKINDAYQILNDPIKAKKYRAGLALEASLATTQQADADYFRSLYNDGYRAPLRCGYILAEGQQRLGRFVISKILGWEDITRADGKTLVSSWDMDAERIKEEWV
jgi:hypothetical protein